MAVASTSSLGGQVAFVDAHFYDSAVRGVRAANAARAARGTRLARLPKRSSGARLACKATGVRQQAAVAFASPPGVLNGRSIPQCWRKRVVKATAGKNAKGTKGPTGDDDVALLKDLEIREPEVEQDAEQAALTVGAAALFGAVVWTVLGSVKGEEYFAGYLLEQSLSVDNLFVFVLVFNYFNTPMESQKVVLTYGIATAAVLRLVLILLGADVVEKWKPILLVFAFILLVSSGKLLLGGDEDKEEDLANNSIVKFSKGLFDFTDEYDGDKFFTTAAETGKTVATPLLLVLLIIELSDVIFAVDSIPAVFGVTLDPFIVYSSNMFAILSLRGLYGFVSNVLTKLVYLEKSVALVLGFIGLKIMVEFFGYPIPTEASLGVVVAILGAGVGASLLVRDEE
jgi:TerC family integral membrane protein